MIDEILDLSIGDIVGINKRNNLNPKLKCWNARIYFNQNSKSLGYFQDPFTAGMVYSLVKHEINPEALKNMFIFKSNGIYYVRKTVKGKQEILSKGFKNIEDARLERDLLEKYDWSLEKVCECADETINGKIIVNNCLVGIVEV